MKYIIYTSTSKYTTKLVNKIYNFRESNELYETTGCLLIVGNNILQLIEGPNVNCLWKNIQNDTIHENIQLLRQGESSERLFPDWTMGYNDLNYSDKKEFSKFLINTAKLSTKDPKVNLIFDTFKLLYKN